MSVPFPPPRYGRVCRMIGHCLILQDEPDAWLDLADVLALSLTREERGLMLLATSIAADPDDLLAIATKAIADLGAGSPLPALDRIDDAARWWADLATLPELKAWLSACFVRLSLREQRAFLETAMRRDAA